MRIAFFADTYFPHMTGVAVSIKYFYEALKELNYKIILFAPSVPNFKDEDPTVIRLPSFRIFPTFPPQVRAPLLLPTKNFRRLFLLDFEIIHGHGSGLFSLLAVVLGKIRKIPVIITFHTDWAKYSHYLPILNPRIINWALKTLANSADLNITPSLKMKQTLESIGVKKPVEVIPSFINLERFKDSQKGFLKRHCHIPKDQLVLLSVGRFGKEKNFDFLISTFAEVILNYPNTHLVIAGEGPEKNNLEQLAKRLNLEKWVHIVGPFNYQDMPKVYADAALFVFASTTETQGLAVLEAASSGLPLVLINDLAFKEIIKDGFNGYLSPASKGIFAKKILEVLQNKDLRNQFSKNSIKLAAENFDKSVILSKLIEVYNHFAKHKLKVH